MIWVAYILGFGLAVGDWPLAYADAGFGRWMIAWAGIAILLWGCRRAPPLLSGLAVIAWALISMIWAPDHYNAMYFLMMMMLLIGVFVVGASGYVEAVYTGAAWGLAVNSAVIVAQLFGWDFVPQVSPPAGLFGNRDWTAEAAALVIIPALARGQWKRVAMLAPALIIPQGRAALLAVTIALPLIWRRGWLLSLAVVAGVVGLSAYKLHGGLSHNDELRLSIWGYAWAHSTWLGHGVGQFFSTAGDPLFHPSWGAQHAHNDWLELLYDLGLVGVGLALVFVIRIAFLDGELSYRAVWLGFSVMCFFSFSLHNPATAVLGLLAAGSVYGSSSMVHGWRDQHADVDFEWLPPKSRTGSSTVAV